MGSTYDVGANSSSDSRASGTTTFTSTMHGRL